MKPVRIYTTSNCPFCTRAKNLLKSKNIPFQEIDVTNDPAARDKIAEQTGWMTVPMIFIGDEFVGGSDDLDALARSGELDKKLKAS